MKKYLFWFLLLAFFIKQIVWLAIIPVWHFPDEEQHFGQVAFWAEKGYFPAGKEFDINKEIDQASEILGTKRDERGNNRFTYHPEFRITYLNGKTGIYEEKIASLNTPSNRQTMVKREAARYGPVFYILSAIPYKLLNKSDLLARVFFSRLVSVLLATLTAGVIYLIARELFKNQILRLSLTFITAFQPMFSFVSSGVNSDNLFNLIFALILLSCLKIFFPEQRKFGKGTIFACITLIAAVILGIYSKQQIVISLPIIIFAFFLSLIKVKRQNRAMVLAALGIIFLLCWLLFKEKFRIPEYEPQIASKLKENFFQYIYWHMRHTIAETIPWYWGVFNWLGVTLPRWFNRIQSRLLVLSALGVGIYFYQQIKAKIIFNSRNLKIIFLFGAAAIYYFSLISWDYFFRRSQGFSFGIQGRYFFPTTVSHMLFMLIGLLTLFPKSVKTLGLKLINLWWVFFSFVGLYTATKAYYQLIPLKVFLSQVSQYKIGIIKSPGIIIIFLLFLLSLIYYLVNFLKTNVEDSDKNY